MNRNPLWSVSLGLLLFLGASFLFQAPKKGMFRGSPKLLAPVAEAGTEYPTSVTTFSYPSISDLSLNGGSNIVLNSNTTKAVSLSGVVTDNDGCSDLSTLKGVIYLNALDLSCSSDDNSCYTGGDVTCSTSTCNAGQAEVTCSSRLWFHANSEQWAGSIMVTDGSDNTVEDTTSTPVTVEELLALLTSDSIHYGSLSVGSTTSTNQTVSVTTVGNVAIDCSLSGTDMTSSSAVATLDVQNQKYGLSDDGYASLANTLLSTDAALNLASGKPTTNPSDQTDITYWGLRAPSGSTAATDYGGLNTFTSTPGS